MTVNAAMAPASHNPNSSPYTMTMSAMNITKPGCTWTLKPSSVNIGAMLRGISPAVRCRCKDAWRSRDRPENMAGVAGLTDWRTGAESLRVAVTAGLAGVGHGCRNGREQFFRCTAVGSRRCGPRAVGGSGRTALTAGIGCDTRRAGVGTGYFSADDAADAADLGEEVVRAQRNDAGRCARDDGGKWAPDDTRWAREPCCRRRRGWGTPAVVGADTIVIGDRYFSVGGVVVAEGDVISIDGATGDVVLGEMATASGGPPEEFFTLLSWADEIRAGHLAVRANADTGDDAMKARELGAEGIGLCRTEHMFLAVDRLPVVRRMILAAMPTKKEQRSRSLVGYSRLTSKTSCAPWTACPSRCACSILRCTSFCHRSPS